MLIGIFLFLQVFSIKMLVEGKLVVVLTKLSGY